MRGKNILDLEKLEVAYWTAVLQALPIGFVKKG